jgi:hypothetical protein
MTGERHLAVPLLWARERIARLSDYAGAYASADHRTEVIALGLAHQLVSEHTSFVLVDDQQQETDAVLSAPPAPVRQATGLGMLSIGQGGGGGYNPGAGLGDIKIGGGHGVGATEKHPRSVTLIITGEDKALAPAALRAPFLRRFSTIRQCVTDTRPGDVVFTLIILPNGTVTAMKVTRGHLDSEAQSCLFKGLRRVLLPKADTPRILEMTLRIK